MSQVAGVWWPLLVVSGAQGRNGSRVNGVYELEQHVAFYAADRNTPVFRQRGDTSSGANSGGDASAGAYFLFLAEGTNEWSIGECADAMARRPIAWMHSAAVSPGTPASETKLASWRGNRRAQPLLRVTWAVDTAQGGAPVVRAMPDWMPVPNVPPMTTVAEAMPHAQGLDKGVAELCGSRTVPAVPGAGGA